jgi:hypothetical protein
VADPPEDSLKKRLEDLLTDPLKNPPNDLPVDPVEDLMQGQLEDRLEDLSVNLMAGSAQKTKIATRKLTLLPGACNHQR